MKKFKVRKGELFSPVSFKNLENAEKLEYMTEAHEWYASHPDAAPMREAGLNEFRKKLDKSLGVGNSEIRTWLKFNGASEKLKNLWLESAVSSHFFSRKGSLADEDLEEALKERVIESPSGAKYWIEDGSFKTDFDCSVKTKRERAEELIVAKKWMYSDFRADAASENGTKKNAQDIASAFEMAESESRMVVRMHKLGSKNVIDAYYNGYINQAALLKILKEGKRQQNILLTESIGDKKAGTNKVVDDFTGVGDAVIDMGSCGEKSGIALSEDSDMNGSYFETRIYRNNAKTTGQNLRNSFGEDGENELRLVIKYLVNMISGRHKYKDMEEYSQFNYLKGISDGEIKDIGEAVNENIMSPDEILEVFGHTDRIIHTCMDVYNKKLKSNG